MIRGSLLNVSTKTLVIPIKRLDPVCSYAKTRCGSSVHSVSISNISRVPFDTKTIVRNMSGSTAPAQATEEITNGHRPQGIEIFEAVEDHYQGVIVKIEQKMDPESFTRKLRASISQWRLQGKKGVWINLPCEYVNLVEPAVKEGFRFHHAEPDYLMVVSWISDSPDTIPANASHRVGVGACVLNDKREVLVVQEMSGPLKSGEGTDIWKLPTGVVNAGEDIADAAIREVKEETGIDAEFVEVLAFRQSHMSFFGKSDMFFVCMLRARSLEIRRQDLEILEAKWMPVWEYASLPFNQKASIFREIADICVKKAEEEYTGFSPVPATTWSGRTTYLYSNTHLLVDPADKN